MAEPGRNTFLVTLCTFTEGLENYSRKGLLCHIVGEYNPKKLLGAEKPRFCKRAPSKEVVNL